MKKLQTLTLGCSKNKVDTEHILSQVENLYEIVPEGEDIPVDVLLLNTCGFIGDAKEESINMILEFCEAKEEGRLNKLYVMGCLSERYLKELEEESGNSGNYGLFDQHTGRTGVNSNGVSNGIGKFFHSATPVLAIAFVATADFCLCFYFAVLCAYYTERERKTIFL